MILKMREAEKENGQPLVAGRFVFVCRGLRHVLNRQRVRAVVVQRVELAVHLLVEVDADHATTRLAAGGATGKLATITWFTRAALFTGKMPSWAATTPFV